MRAIFNFSEVQKLILLKAYFITYTSDNICPGGRVSSVLSLQSEDPVFESGVEASLLQ